MSDPSIADQTPTPLRRQPSQARARERVERILECATELIGREGSAAMRMATLAEMAGVSIGSLYQYFPDKSAVIRALAERCYAESRHCIAEGLAHVSTAEEVGPAFAALIDEYYEMFLAAPAICDIWAGTQADKSLQELEVSESRENGAVLAGVLARLNPKADRAALQAAGFLIMHMGETTMRLAVTVGRDEGDAIVDAYKRMAAAELKRAVAGEG